MTDIVERLRDPNKWAGTSDSDHNPLPSHAMALEAADKIEFLMKTHDDMSDEIERLREALHTIVATKAINETNPRANAKMMWIGCTQIAEAALKRDE